MKEGENGEVNKAPQMEVMNKSLESEPEIEIQDQRIGEDECEMFDQCIGKSRPYPCSFCFIGLLPHKTRQARAEASAV